MYLYLNVMDRLQKRGKNMASWNIRERGIRLVNADKEETTGGEGSVRALTCEQCCRCEPWMTRASHVALLVYVAVVSQPAQSEAETTARNWLKIGPPCALYLAANM
jgi:hypothetical protein